MVGAGAVGAGGDDDEVDPGVALSSDRLGNVVADLAFGPPGSQHVLKVTTQQAADGTTTVARSDIYHGSIVNFVPFTKLEGDQIKGTHFGM